ncbi:helix-turn-helix domain-containing protein [Streptomyces sp. NPDC005349]|uniref:TetR/AcrR family transcriptional regulator n=1 Tax=Streptomyces sp. NPDC005349 TaxID=3157037 RepID=UPI0033AB8274
MTGQSAAASRRPDRARTRRSSAAVRAELLDAAREVFGERGYAGTRTRDIAERAHATEQTMYRHFRTKEELFEQAVFEPFGELVSAFITEFEERAERSLSPERLTRDYVTMLFHFLRQNRAALMSLLPARAQNPELFSAHPLDQLFPVLEEALATGRRDHQQPGGDARLGVRLTFGMVLSAAVLDGQFLGLDADNEIDRLLDALTAYVLTGLMGRA